METTNELINDTQGGQLAKSEILFLYESTYSIPNGDPFTGEQRYDEETKKVLVSDVRIKRFIRDYMFNNGKVIYVVNDTSKEESGDSGAAARFRSLREKYKSLNKTAEILKECIDVRLFGGILTLKDSEAKKIQPKIDKGHVNITGPVQFALLNPSLNEVDLRMHQNTSVFASSVEKSQGAIGTTTVVPYAVNQIHGWVNPYSAKHTDLTNSDVNMMFQALWESINCANTRSKSNQNSLLLFQIIYSEPTKKLYGLDRLIKISSNDNKRGEQLRSIDDFDFDFSKLIDAVKSNIVTEVRYYCEFKDIENQITSALGKDNNKFKKMNFAESKVLDKGVEK